MHGHSNNGVVLGRQRPLDAQSSDSCLSFIDPCMAKLPTAGVGLLMDVTAHAVGYGSAFDDKSVNE